MPASATPIIYTFSGNISGTQDGGQFTNTQATFTAVGDTTGLTTTADGSRNVALSSF
jgi:hypothetical protein